MAKKYLSPQAKITTFEETEIFLAASGEAGDNQFGFDWLEG